MSLNTVDTTREYYIGIMSGTSIDGLDGVLVGISNNSFEIVESTSIRWDPQVQSILNDLCTPRGNYDYLDSIYLAANEVARHEAMVVDSLLSKSGFSAKDIVAIGAHGQTVRHMPQDHFSAQIDNGAVIAALTGIDAIVNFRAADLAQGGQGAPLTQAFHQRVFHSDDTARFIMNLGGITNITFLSPFGSSVADLEQGHKAQSNAQNESFIVTAFDSGPANTLIDYVCRNYAFKPYDHKGSMARQGKLLENELTNLLAHPYLHKPYPKSTGREDFNDSLIKGLMPQDTAPDYNTICNVLNTLVEYTATTAVNAIKAVIKDHEPLFNCKREIILCGGGVFNDYLKERITALANPLDIKLRTCDEFGVDPSLLEAQAFAFFAYCNKHAIALDLCSSTKAHAPSILGALYPAAAGHYARTMAKLYAKS